MAGAQDLPPAPAAARGDVVDNYHGVRVPDPYRSLEDPDSTTTQAWVEAQNKRTVAYFAKNPHLEPIKARLTKVWDFARMEAPQREDRFYYYTRNSGLQNQEPLYRRRVNPGSGSGGTNWGDSAAEELMLDPNTLSKDGTVALAGWAVDRDEHFLAYMTAEAGSDWNEARVMRLDTHSTEPDHLKWLKFTGLAWDANSQGFFYSRFPAPSGGNSSVSSNKTTSAPAEAKEDLTSVNYYQKLYYHRLGTSQDQDKLIISRPDDKELGFSPAVTDDHKYLVVYVSRGTDVRNGLYVGDLPAVGGPPEATIDGPATTATGSSGGFVRIQEVGESMLSLAGNFGRTFFFVTNRDAPRGKVVAINLDRPQPENWITVVGESDEIVSEGSAVLVANQLVVHSLKDARSTVRRYRIAGGDELAKERGHSNRPHEAPADNPLLIGEIPLPGLGVLADMHGRLQDREMFFAYESPTMPPTIFRYYLGEVMPGSNFPGRLEKIFSPTVDFRSDDYDTTQTFARGRDGARIPIFVTARKGLKLDNTNPTRLYAYGGFAVNEAPWFRISSIPWLERGGVFATAIIRGGAEYGEEWHKQGMLANKQTVFDDFFAAAEHLIAEGWTTSSKLGCEGGSNGGLLVGAAITQRPDLWRAANPNVGVMDMLRFHKYTIGWAWTAEYGSSDDPAMFPILRRYSPLHNIRECVSYPSTLLMTGDHDDRVVPAHTFKFTAALQRAQIGPNPILLRVDVRAGHGAGKPTMMRIQEAAEKLAFFAQELGMKPE